METNQVLQEKILALAFNHERSSVIYLSQPSFQGENLANELIELDLHNQTVLERYVVSNQLPNQPPFLLLTSKRKGLLILAFQPSLMEIWQLGNSAQGFNQSIWSGETKGKKGYEIQSADVSQLDGTFFFSALGQRNIYCANIDDTIQSNSPQLNTSKMKLPLKVSVNDIKCHPFEQKVFAACSDGQVRIWNSNTFTELISIQDETSVTSLAFQLDGQKLLTGCEDGKIQCWDGKTLGNRNILLAIYKLKDNLGILCLNWLNYNGSTSTEDFLCYNQDGSVKYMNIKLLVPQEMIREQKVSKTKKQELFGSLTEKSTLMNFSIDNRNIKINIGQNRFIQVHPYANFISITNVKVINDQLMYVGSLYYQFNTQIILLNPNNLLTEYPICSPYYQYSFEQMIPNEKNQILTQRYLYYIDQHTLDIKQYCLAKGNLRAIANLRNIIFGDNALYYQLNIRPNSLNYHPNLQFLISYKLQSSFRSVTVMYNQEQDIVSDNVKEFPSRLSLYLGLEHWANPPLFLLYEDRQSYSLIFENTLPEEEECFAHFTQGDRDKLLSCMKQSLNLKVQSMFWTPLRKGFVVIYQPVNENILKFSRNRNTEYLITDMLMQSGQEMIFRLNNDDQITDVVFQKNYQQYIGAVVTILNVHIINENLQILKSISLQPQINQNNRILKSYWCVHTLIVQSKFHILYVLMNGKCASIQSLDNYEDKNLLSVLLWDRALILSSNHLKKNITEIKTKFINLVQPILQGYLHHSSFLELEIDANIVSKLLQIFGNPNIEFSLVHDLEQMQLRTCSKFVMQLDDCKQFTQVQKAKFYMNTLDDKNLMETLFGSDSLLNNLDLQKQLSKKLNDPRFEYLKILYEDAQKYFSLSFQYKLAATISAIISSSPNYIINVLAGQNKLGILSQTKENPKIYQLLSKSKQQPEQSQENNNYFLANSIKSDNGNYFTQNIPKLIEKLEEQLKFIQISMTSDQEMQPSYYFTEYLLQKLKILLKDSKPIKNNVGFGEEKYKLVYEDLPHEDDEVDHIVNNKVIRFFDSLTYDSIVFFLGVGGQPQVKTSQQQKQQQTNVVQQNKSEPSDFGNDDDPKEFQDLLIYWRIDEGKGSSLKDLGNYECSGDIYINGEISADTEHCWERLEDSKPMEQEDIWGKRCDAQCGFQLGNGVGFQTSKKNYWKRRKLECFTLELWINIQSSNGQILEVGDGDFKIYLEADTLHVGVKQYPRIQFSVEANEDNVETSFLKLNIWNHICITYEAAQNQVTLYLNAKYTFNSQELELPQDLLIDKYLMFGEVKANQNALKCQVTEFRFWKQKLSLKEIQDGFRTPLAIVSEKKTKLNFEFKDKKPKKAGDLKQFIQMMAFEQPIQQEQIDQSENKQQIEQQEQEQQEYQQQQEQQQHDSDYFNSQTIEQAKSQPMPSTFNEFTQFQEFGSVPQQQAAFNSDFSQSFGANFGTDWGIKAESEKKEKTSISPIKINLQIQEIQEIVDQALEAFGFQQVQKGVDNLGKAFDKLGEYLKGNGDKLKKIQKFIIHCATYRFAFQLLIGIKQMHDTNNKKKELYLYLILIHLNLKPNHRVYWIIQTINKSIEFDNSALADQLAQQLKQSLDKIQVQVEDLNLLKQCQQKLEQINEKQNQQLMRMSCPNCQKHFHFKGLKKCSKCQKEFSLCSLTLSCISKEKRSYCKACESVFNISKKGEQCPICKLSQLT